MPNAPKEERKPSLLDRIKKINSEKSPKQSHRKEKRRDKKDKEKKYSSKDFLAMDEEVINIGSNPTEEYTTKAQISK